MSSARSLGPVVLVAWLAGCQTLTSGENPQPVATTDPAQNLGRPTGEPPPAVLSDMVYSVLVGEIATQRHRFDVAYKHYLYAARLSKHPEIAELATKTALAAQDEDAALEAAEYWIELQPAQTGARQIAVLLKAQTGDLDGAVAELKQLIALTGARGENGYLEAARLLAKIKDDALRLELMRRLTNEDGQDPDALFALAMIEAGSRNFERSEAAVRQVLKERPRWSEARVFLVRILVLQDDTEGARRALEEFLADTPDDVALRAAYARMLVEQEDYASAREEFRRLLEVKPRDPDALFALGILSIQLGDRPSAREYLLQLYDHGERRNEAAYYLGQVFQEDGDSDEALNWLDRVQGANFLEAQIRIARIYAERGEVSRAREIIQQLRGHAGEQAAQLYLIESEILRDLGRQGEAMEVLNLGVAASPDDHDLLYARALLAASLDRVDQLETDLGRILSEDPDHADALNALGYTLADQTTRYQEALGYITRALMLKPDNAAILDSLGWVQFRLGNHQEALRHLWRAMELLPDAEIAAHLGEVLWVAGERERARAVWADALAKDPESPHLQRVMQRFK